jgi:hypothetical protein
MKNLPKLFLIVALFVSFILINPATTFAKTACGEGQAITKDCYDAHMQTVYQWTNMLSGIVGCGIGDAPLLPSGANTQCITYDQSGQLVAYSKLPEGGALAFVDRAIATTFVPSISANAYVAHMRQGFDPASTAYAQQIGGSGVGVIQPVLNLWLVIRNFSYLLFIVIFLAVGFMIMFRQKLNPQTVITVQSALPSLVIGLILVTFSYFISALIIDFTYVAMWLVANIFKQAGSNIVTNIDYIVQQGSIFSLWHTFTQGGDTLHNEITVPLMNGTESLLNFSRTPDSLSNAPQQITAFGDIAAKIFGTIIGGIAGVLIGAIVMIALFVQLMRLLYSLITSYISILVVTVMSPLIILWASVPGQGKKMDLWWRNILGNIMVFPAVFATFLFAGFFLSNTKAEDFQQTLPFFAGLPIGLLKSMIGFGILLGITSIPGTVKSAFGVKDLGSIASDAFKGVGVGAAVGYPIGRGVVRSGANFAFNTMERTGDGTRAQIWGTWMRNKWGKTLGL